MATVVTPEDRGLWTPERPHGVRGGKITWRVTEEGVFVDEEDAPVRSVDASS